MTTPQMSGDMSSRRQDENTDHTSGQQMQAAIPEKASDTPARPRKALKITDWASF